MSKVILSKRFWANQPIHSFLVGCLNPCLQGTSARVGSPQPSKSNLFFKFTFCNGWTPWCYWRFEFKYAAWVPLDANTFVVFWSSKSSLIINLFSPCHKIMYIMGFQTLKYIEYYFWTWWGPYKLCIWPYMKTPRSINTLANHIG
jgi:hypothetical protein